LSKRKNTIIFIIYKKLDKNQNQSRHKVKTKQKKQDTN